MSAFKANAHAWSAAGWGAFPLPAGQKSPPPQGWTGRGAPYPSGADVQAWIEEHPDANLGLRFPMGVVGIDVDEYEGKHGLATLSAHTKQWGQLPRAPRITSRINTRSGIYLYKLPDDVTSDRFMGELPGGSVEILRPEHRYAVGPGSKHPEGRDYVLLLPSETKGPAGPTSLPPTIHRGALRREQLPTLPAAWVEGLTLAEKATVDHDVHLAGGRGDAYTQAAVARVVAELHEIADWPDKKTDAKGRGWEKIQADAAYRLASLALADWNSLTITDAMNAFGAAAPIGGGWTGADVASKWRSQMRRAEPADPPKTSDDPLSPGYQPPAAEQAAFEEMVTDGRSDDRVPGDGVPADDLGGERVDAGAVPTALPTQVAAEWVKHSWDDMGNAERVVELFGARLRYLASIDRWMEYDEEHGRWEESKTGGQRAVMRMVEVLPKLEAHLYSTTKRPKGAKGETSDREEFLEWCAKQRNTAPQRSGAEMLKTSGLLNDDPRSFDADPMLLNCRNGILDLVTGELLPHDPVRKLRRQIPVHYNASAPAPKWEEYIAHAHPEAELRGYLQRITGYSLTGSTKEQVFFIHQGPPNSGKSVYLNVMTELLGDLSRVIPASTLFAKKNEGHPTEIMGLAGRRMLTSSESAEGARLDAALVKRLSGSDFISARGMGQDFVDFKLVGKIHLVTNHLPHIPDDDALKRRIHIMPWNIVIAGEEIDYDLEEDILRTELPGVLAWAVRGALEWNRIRLDRPTKAHLVTLDYFEEEDEFGDFLSELLAPSMVTWTATKTLFQLYVRWADSNHVRPMTKIAFARKMAKKGFKPYRDASTRGFWCTLATDPINSGAKPDPFDVDPLAG